MVLETIILAVGITSVVTYETTGKGITDHAISAVRGQDCKLARSFQGESVCEPRGTVTVETYAGNTVQDYEKVLAQRRKGQ